MDIRLIEEKLRDLAEKLRYLSDCHEPTFRDIYTYETGLNDAVDIVDEFIAEEIISKTQIKEV